MQLRKQINAISRNSTFSRWAQRYKGSPLLLLGFWIAIGLVLRVTRLTILPPWTDEVSSIVFSLGNSFEPIPVNDFISSDTLLQPLQPSPENGIAEVVKYLFAESTHPPLYFILTHEWLKLFPTVHGHVSLWGARSLSLLFGVAAIPALYSFGYFAFRSRLVGHFAAALMAVSPLGVFLAQKARHYTLAILLIIASVACLLVAIRAIHRYSRLPIWICLTWVGVNAIGVATHFFFVLTFPIQGLVLLKQAWQQTRQEGFRVLGQESWRRIYAVAIGTIISCIVWLPLILFFIDKPSTDWLFEVDNNLGQTWWSLLGTVLLPIARMILWLGSMLVMLPSDTFTFPLGIIIIVGVITLGFLIFWVIPLVQKGLKIQQQKQEAALATQVIRDYVIAALLLYFAIDYLIGMDLTAVARYQYVYFPILLLLIGATLAGVWQHLPNYRGWIPVSGKVAVTTILVMGLVGGITTTWNLGYLKNHRPDLVAAKIREGSPQLPIAIVAPSYKGRMMGIAWDFLEKGERRPLFFLLDYTSEMQNPNVSHAIFQEKLRQLPRPLDVWFITVPQDLNLESQGCVADPQYQGSVAQWKYKLYHCLPQE